MTNRPDWQNDAACKDVAREKFFGQGPKNEAKKICHGCPVEEVCLWYGMMMEYGGVRYGTFGGATGDQREDLAQRLGITQETAEQFYIEELHYWEERKKLNAEDRG